MSSLLSELRRRNVPRVAAAYAVVAWILIEAGSVLMPTFGAPEWIFKVYVLLVIAGFMGALVFAWVYELTSDGLKLESELAGAAERPRGSGRRFDFIIIALLGVALAISVTLNVAGLRDASIPQAMAGERSIAVLPFENRSLDAENALFADGIHDDLLTSLANIASLKVISRTSVLGYRDTARNLRQIGSELGVTTILEGAVQRIGDSVRINVQLIDVATDQHLWAKTYDRELTTANIFAIQSEISSEITGALKAELTDEEQVRMKAVPTTSLEAYSLYTEGRRNLHERRLETLLEAREQFEQAIELDPNYSQAYAGLADSLLLLFINHNALTPSVAFPLAEEALNNALALDEMNADAYASLGLLLMNKYGKERDGPWREQAEDAYKKALKLNPNHATAYMWFASLRNMEFRYQESIDLYKKSLHVDPLGRIPRMNLAGLHAQLGHEAEATLQLRELIRLHPTWPIPYSVMAGHLARFGRFDEAMAWSVKARELSTDPLEGQAALAVLLEFDEIDTAVESIDLIPADHAVYPVKEGYQLSFKGDYAGAIASWLQALESSQEKFVFVYGSIAALAVAIGQYDTAREYVLKSHPEFADGNDPKLNPENADSGILYAFLLQKSGDTKKADKWLAAALKVVNEMPRLGSGGHGINDVQILALQGKPAAALSALQAAYTEGFRGTQPFEAWSLEEDPFLESIRNRAEFHAVEADIARDVAVMRERVHEAERTGDWNSLRQLVVERARKRLPLAGS